MKRHELESRRGSGGRRVLRAAKEKPYYISPCSKKERLRYVSEVFHEREGNGAVIRAVNDEETI